MPKISLAGWSLHRRFRDPESPLKLLDYPRVAREEFGMSAVELNNVFFESTDESYLAQLNEAAAQANVALVGMAVDRTGDPSSLDETERLESIAAIKKWLPVAQSLGLPFFRVNTGGQGRESDPESLRNCIASFRELAKEAEGYGIKLVIENHWGISANPLNIVRIIEEVASPFLGTLPDFGNFPDESRPEVLAAIQPEIPKEVTPGEIRYWGLEVMAPYAMGVHAKMFEFDAQGNDTRINVARCIEIIRGAGFDGYWGIEFEGAGDDHEGVLKSKELLEKHLGAR